MPNSWGRPPRNDMWQDLQVLAFWVLIIGVAGYIIFPSFFKDVYSRLTDPTAQMVDSDSGLYDPNSLSGTYDTGVGVYDTGTYDSGTINGLLNSNSNSTNSVTSAMYNLSNEVSTGYWVLFVADGEFKQMAVTTESYTFLQHLIEKDRSVEGKNTVILAANGQIKKYVVTDEIYAIITNMAVIDTRVKTG